MRLFAIFIYVMCFHIELFQSLHCNEHFTSQNVQLILDYARWRDVKALIIYDESLKTSYGKRIIVSCFTQLQEMDLFVSFQSSMFLQYIERTGKYGVVSFLSTSTNYSSIYSLFDDVSRLGLYIESVSWLLITDRENHKNITEKLQNSSLNLNSDLVIAIRVPCSDYYISACPRKVNGSKNEINRDDGDPPLPPIMVTNKSSETKTHSDCSEMYSLRQLYKIRKDTSLVIRELGLWNCSSGFVFTNAFLAPEKRGNFQKFPLKLAKKNYTISDSKDNSDEDLIEIANYFQQFLNASEELVYFQKLGHKENDGEWTDLLRAVVNGDVDLGLDGIIKTPERYYDMAFSHKIFTSMRCIYIKPQESNELRDIFLIPFGTRLILCVIGTGTIFSVFITLMNKIINKISEDGVETKNYTLSETVTWCIGIFCMQGGVWTPRTCSGNIVLITSLAFALIIFNSYSAFITSILSVEVANIQSIDDLLESSYNIGYAKNSQDEIYLRSMNDTQLQQIYLRGYLHNTVSNVTQGLLKSSRGHYGFFVSANLARKELQVINKYKCNYDITEIPLLKTKNSIAFPMAQNSSYKKVINLSIIKMYETGIYKYIHSMLVPDLTSCNRKKIFRSANLPDLISAFGILIAGIQISLIVLIIECLWKKKKCLYQTISKHLFKKFQNNSHKAP